MMKGGRSGSAFGALLACAVLGAFAPACRCGDSGGGAGAALDAAVSAGMARLEGVKGRVLLERQGVSAAVLQGELEAGDVVLTPDDGSAILQLPDGRTVELGPASRVQLKRGEGGELELQVLAGTVLSRTPATLGQAVRQGAAVLLSILTPEGITRIGAGQSEVQISVGEVVRVDVRMGQVEFLAGAERNLLGEGDSLTVVAGKIEVLSRNAPVQVELSPVEVLARNGVSGRAEVKKAGTRTWKTVGKDGLALGEGDGVRSRRGRSVLGLGDSPTQVTLEDGAEVAFTRAGTQGSAERAELDLKKGAVALQVDVKRTLELALSGLELSSVGGGDLLVRRAGTGYDIEVRTGDARLARGDQVETVPAGSRARVRGTEPVQVSKLERAPLVLPSRHGQKIFHLGLPEVALGWEGEGEDFRVEVATDKDFKERVLGGRVHEKLVNVPVPARGWLYWRVTTPDGATEVASGSAQVGPEPRRKDLATVRNEVPDGAEKTTIFFQDKVPALTLTFTEEKGAAKYRVLIYRAKALQQAALERWVTEPKAVLEPDALTEGQYVWSATPVDAKGKPLRTGRMTPLDIIYDNAVSSLVVTAPREGERLSGERRVEAAGVAPLGARVYVNGQPAPLDDKHRFRVTVAPSGQPPVVVFRMARGGSPDVYTVRTLKRGR